MNLKSCEFEEAEFRGPLFHQLQDSNFLWEPGQVFENHIGIDRALWTASLYLHELHGHTSVLSGVSLGRMRWAHIWPAVALKKRLPTFKLNLFIQAKRPQYGKVPPKNLRDKGLKSPFWRFKITPHQQVSLEKLSRRLGRRSIVCYACPAFHTERELYRWTIEPRIVEHTTFPDVSVLSGHSAWNYSAPGVVGVANVDPTYVTGLPLLERVEFISREFAYGESDPIQELRNLASDITSVMEAFEADGGFLAARFFERVHEIQAVLKQAGEESASIQPAVDYLTIGTFCDLNRLSWLVIGDGG